jgi:hypothetical protein
MHTFSCMQLRDWIAIKNRMGSSLHTCNPLSQRKTTPINFQAFNLLSSTCIAYTDICLDDKELLGGEVFLLTGDALLTGNCSHATQGLE